MVSLWKSPKNGEEESDQAEERPSSSSQSQSGRRSEDANERTGLLPRQRQDRGYLDPDDPAVQCPELANAAKEMLTLCRSVPTTSGASERFVTSRSSFL